MGISEGRQERNRKGTGKEQERNRKGTGKEQERNRKGTGKEQEWGVGGRDLFFHPHCQDLVVKRAKPTAAIRSLVQGKAPAGVGR